jgi:hypothetical protein
MNYMSTKPTSETINEFLAEPLRVGEPAVSGALAVFPLFGPAPRLEYLSLAEGRERGAAVQELDRGGSVNDLVVDNSTDAPLLLFEGEEVLGAQQNRTFDVSVLAPPHRKVTVPVSCVEAGRWEMRRHAEGLRPAPQAAYPRLRRMKAMQVRERVAAGLDARADQMMVWDEVAETSHRHGAASPTGAMHDLFERRRNSLRELCDSIPLHDGQVGSIAALAGELWVLDYVSRPEVYAALHGPLVQGYALDALEASDGEPPELSAARGFALLVADAALGQRSAGIGLGEDVRFAANGISGSGLVNDGELIQLTAFPGGEDEPEGQAGPQPASRIRRPSRRRHR